MRALVSIPAALLLGVAIHVDWHLARPHHHGGLSGGFTYHWLLAVPVFGAMAWHLSRRFVRPVAAAAVTIGAGVLLGQGLEPLGEYVLYGEPFSETFGPERLGAFAAFIGAGLVTFALVAWRVRAPRAIAVAALLLAPAVTHAQQPEPLDGPRRLFQDSLFERLGGTWTMSGTVRGRPATYSLRAEWVLNHQFLRLDMRDVNDPPAYQATVYIGYDNTSERYVAHWLDAFGGRYSETLGYGRREGSAVRFVFEYPDGPFQTTFALDAKTGLWSVLMRTKAADGTWGTFAEYVLQRR